MNENGSIEWIIFVGGLILLIIGLLIISLGMANVTVIGT